jgi:hypothetical protein
MRVNKGNQFIFIILLLDRFASLQIPPIKAEAKEADSDKGHFLHDKMNTQVSETKKAQGSNGGEVEFC